MASIIDIAEAVEGDSFEIRVDGVDFEDEESSWESLLTIWEGAPEFVMAELRKLGLRRTARSRL